MSLSRCCSWLHIPVCWPGEGIEAKSCPREGIGAKSCPLSAFRVLRKFLWQPGEAGEEQGQEFLEAPCTSPQGKATLCPSLSSTGGMCHPGGVWGSD